MPHSSKRFPCRNSKGLNFPPYSATTLLAFFNFSLLNFPGKSQTITIFSSEGGDLQENITLDVLWFSKGKAESHVA